MSDSLWPHGLEQCLASLSFTIPQSLIRLMSIGLVMPSKHLILWCPLLLPSISPSIRIFSNELAPHIRWPEYWSFSFSISPSNEYSGLISFRSDWSDLLAVQGTLKSLLQHRHSKTSTLWCSAYFMVQLSHPYMTSGKTRALTRWTFVGKMMFLIFNILSRSVIFPSKEQASFNFITAVTICSDFEAQENKTCHDFQVSPNYLMGPDAMILVFLMLSFNPTFSPSSFTHQEAL